MDTRHGPGRALIQPRSEHSKKAWEPRNVWTHCEINGGGDTSRELPRSVIRFIKPPVSSTHGWEIPSVEAFFMGKSSKPWSFQQAMWKIAGGSPRSPEKSHPSIHSLYQQAAEFNSLPTSMPFIPPYCWFYFFRSPSFQVFFSSPVSSNMAGKWKSPRFSFHHCWKDVQPWYTRRYTGWWLSHPSEKYDFVNWDENRNPNKPNINGNMPKMATKPPTRYSQ